MFHPCRRLACALEQLAASVVGCGEVEFVEKIEAAKQLVDKK
jgi:hypothetical protein